MPMLTDSQRTALLERLRRGRAPATDSIERRDPQARDLPLSFGQEQLWFIDRFAPQQAMYNIPLAIGVRGELDAAALQAAVTGVVARHEALRTRLVAGAGGQPVQLIDPPARVPVAFADRPGGERLDEYIDAEAMRPFDLAAGPLARFSLIRLADDEHVLLVVVHHVVFDGWSAGVLVREVAALYRQEASGAPSGLAELPVQFADYALWERDRLADAESPPSSSTELTGYWLQAMRGFEMVRFPADLPRPVVEDWAGGLDVRTTDPALVDRLRELSRRQGTTLFVTLMTGLQALLHRYTGQTDLVVGTVSANRRRPELAPLIGFLVNTLPIRVDASGNPSFTDLLARVREATLGAYAHQDLPFGKMVDTLAVPRDPSRTPVFQIALAYNERDRTPIEAAGARFAMTDLVAGVHAAKFDLSFVAEPRADGLWLECSYKTSLFRAPSVRRLLEHLEILLAGAVANPGARLSELPMLTDSERHRELFDWNALAKPHPVHCVHEAFEQQAARTPDAIAATCGPERMTYAELDRRAERIAHELRERGVGPESLVGVCLPASPARLAALLGIWKAGGGYVPLDPELPAGRLEFMLADTGMTLMIADEQTAPSLPSGGPATIMYLDDLTARAAAGEPRTRAPVTAENVAYVIYTSGSTGQPKGVVIEHRQAIGFLYNAIDAWQVGPADSVLQFASLNFDASVVEIFMPLLVGAKVVLAAPQTLHSPPKLAALIRDADVTFACLTPAVLNLLSDHDLPSVRTMLAAGEELPSDLVGRWLRPGLRFINAYGPTETTVIAVYQELTEQTQLPPPIGMPVANCQTYVLDEYLNPVPAGVTGELHIGGTGVARGYLNRPALTRERFIPDPFRPGGRLYKTGDLCHRRQDGSIVFTGRIDHQVKIRGLRIELGEIETTLVTHPDIAQAVVTVWADGAGDKELTAYVRPEPGRGPSPAEIRAHLATALPSYMIPAHVLLIDEFPLNTSGKIDRRALPRPARAEPAGINGELPATPTERVMTELFAAALHHPSIGPTENFFDSGGNSLQVMRLIDLVAGRIGADLSPVAVFLHPTPRQLAAHVDAAAGPLAGDGPLVPLTAGPGDPRPPLVLIHAVGGTIFDYAKLAELTGACAVHGLQAPHLTRPDSAPQSLDDLLDRYTEVIRAAFPDGPYRLGGWSMGGVIAYEVARRLEHKGAEVSLLVLLDAPFAVPADRAPAEDLLAGQFLADATQSLGATEVAPPDPATTRAADQIAWLAASFDTGAGRGRDDRPETLAARLTDRFEVFKAHRTMLSGYQPEPSAAVAAPTLIVSADNSLNAPTRDQWPRVLTGPVTTLAVDADHYTFLRPPVVSQVASSINGLINPGGY